MTENASPVRTLGEASGFKSLTASVASALQRDLIDGRYRPGEKLPIVKLAQGYGVSPGAVREALARMISEGLVEFNEQRGFRAAPVSQAALIDVTRTRIMIDIEALREAIRLGDVKWEAEVLAIQHRLANCAIRDAETPVGVREEWQRLHRQFHRTLISACGSEWLMRFHDLLFDQSTRFRSVVEAFTSGPPSPPRNAVAEHAEIVEAVVARDVDAASAALERHYQHTTNFLITGSQETTAED